MKRKRKNFKMWQHGDMAAREATMVVHDTVGGHGTQKTAKKTVSKLIRFGTTSGELISESKRLVHFFYTSPFKVRLRLNNT